jgi:hypothetical protein
MLMCRVNTAAVVLVLVVSGCGRSNPLIGKWAIADQSENNPACASLVEVEFTEKTITTGFGAEKNTVTVTYGRDGDSYLASAGNGQAVRVKIESGGIEANGCHLIPALGESDPLIAKFVGKWKLASSLNCDYRLAKLELAETTMTVTVHVGFSGALDSHTTAVTYSRDGEFYVATPTAGNDQPVRFKFNRPNIVLDSGCILIPAS